MARNLREGSQGQINVVAAGDVVAGNAYTDSLSGMSGIAVTDAAAGEVYALDCRPNVHYLFRDAGAATVGELGPEIPVGTFAAGVLTTAGGGTVSAVVLEDGPGDVYNTPAGHTLYIVNPTSV